MENTKEDLVKYYKEVVNGLWENQRISVCSAIQIKHNVEWFNPLLECFKSNKDFCDFLKSIENEYDENHKPTKATTFKLEYLKEFDSFQFKDGLIETHYEKFIRFQNHTTYKHAYLLSKVFATLNSEKLKTKVRMVTTKGIVALNMKSKSKQKVVRDAIKVDENGLSEYRMFPDHFDDAWEFSHYLKDSVVNTFIKSNAKKLSRPSSMKDINNEYSFLRGYHFKYERGNENEISAYKGKREAQRETKQIVSRIARQDKQDVVNTLSKTAYWNGLTADERSRSLTKINTLFRQAKKKWEPIKNGTADALLINAFVKAVQKATK